MKKSLSHSNSMFYGAPASIFMKAKHLRMKMTIAERILWDKLKDRTIFKDFKFRRQHPFNIYIVDFYCHSLKLVIEVDGEYHLHPEQQINDEERTKTLNDFGIRLIRFSNNEVIDNTEVVVEKILSFISETPFFPPPDSNPTEKY